MRVVAFWAAIAGLVGLAGQGAAFALSTVWTEQAGMLPTAQLVAAVGQIAFTALLVALLLIIAVSGRKV